MSADNNKLDKIAERLSNIDARISLLIDGLLSLIQRTNPEHSSFAIYALVAGLTAQELDEIETLFRHASISDNLNIENFKNEFEKRLPRLKDSLVVIAKGLHADGKFPYFCQKILDGVAN